MLEVKHALGGNPSFGYRYVSGYGLYLSTIRFMDLKLVATGQHPQRQVFKFVSNEKIDSLIPGLLPLSNHSAPGLAIYDDAFSREDDSRSLPVSPPAL